MRFLLPFLAVTVFAQTQVNPDLLLERARARLQGMAQGLEKYVCMETVNRNYYRRTVSREAAPACAPGAPPAAGDEGRILEFTDRVRLEVTVSQSRELHSWPGATAFDIRDVDELIRDGPVSTGSFGAYLAGIFGRPGVTFRFIAERSVEGRRLMEYGYRVPLEASRFDVKVEGAWAPVGYEGEFWLDPQSLDLERLTLRTGELPAATAFCKADASLEYQLLHIGGGDVLLPRHSQLDIVNRGEGGRETRNETTFANCREYQAESEMVFDAPAEASVAARPRAGRGRVSLPLGLPVTLAMENAIDTDTAATGDPVSARVVKAVRRPGSNEDLIPAGAVVRGRIRRLEHHLVPKPYFLIAFAFNRMEIAGGVAAFAARHEADADLARELNANLTLRATGIWFWDVGTFLFPTAKPRYTIPAGFESKWFTLATGGP